jgi:O-Antigen ligase
MQTAAVQRAPAPGVHLRVGAPGAAQGERIALVTTGAAVAMLPLLVPAGPANIAPVDALIAAALLACLLWAGTSGHRWRFPYAVPVALLLAGGAIGAIAGPVPKAGIIAIAQDLVLIGWCWVVVNLCSKPRNLRILLATWVYSGICWASLVFVGLATGITQLTGQIERQGTRVQLTLADPSYAANYLLLTFMIIWATGRPRRRPLRYAASVLVLAAMFPTGSNSGLLALIVGMAVAVVVGIFRRHGPGAAAGTLAALAVAGYVVAAGISLTDVQERAHGSRHSFLRDGIGRGTSVNQRSMLMSESVDLYRGGSPLGAGPVSTKPRLRMEQAPFIKEAHDDYIAALIERGVVGFLGVVILVTVLVRHAARIARPGLSAGFAAVVARPHALVGALAGTMVVSIVYEIFHVRHVWTLFAFLAALSIWGRE